jgi:hypothetical protein
MAGSGNGRMGVLGKLRGTLDKRRERRAEKARVGGEAKREWERGGKGPGPHEGGHPGIGASGGGGGA